MFCHHLQFWVAALDSFLHSFWFFLSVILENWTVQEGVFVPFSRKRGNVNGKWKLITGFRCKHPAISCGAWIKKHEMLLTKIPGLISKNVQQQEQQQPWVPEHVAQGSWHSCFSREENLRIEKVLPFQQYLGQSSVSACFPISVWTPRRNSLNKVCFESGFITGGSGVVEAALCNERSCWVVEPITLGFLLQVSLIHVGIAEAISPEQINAKELCFWQIGMS